MSICISTCFVKSAILSKTVPTLARPPLRIMVVAVRRSEVTRALPQRSSGTRRRVRVSRNPVPPTFRRTSCPSQLLQLSPIPIKVFLITWWKNVERMGSAQNADRRVISGGNVPHLVLWFTQSKAEINGQLIRQDIRRVQLVK